MVGGVPLCPSDREAARATNKRVPGHYEIGRYDRDLAVGSASMPLAERSRPDQKLMRS